MAKVRTIFRWAARAARLMVGVPDYATYVQHRRTAHPGEPIMSYEEFYRDRLKARYTVDRENLKGCC